MKKNILLVIAMMTLALGNAKADTVVVMDGDKTTVTDNQRPERPRGPRPEGQNGKDGKQRQRLTREQLAEKQANFIVQQLGLDESTAKKFIDVYQRNKKEVWSVMPARPDRGGKLANNNTNNAPKSDAESEKQIKDEFAMSEKLLDIRQKYYKEYSKFLTQQQILRVYQLERNMHERFAKRHGQRGQGKRMQRPGAAENK